MRHRLPEVRRAVLLGALSRARRLLSRTAQWWARRSGNWHRQWFGHEPPGQRHRLHAIHPAGARVVAWRRRVAGHHAVCLWFAAAAHAGRPGLELHAGRCHEHVQRRGLPHRRDGHAVAHAAVVADGVVDRRFARRLAVHGTQWFLHGRHTPAGTAPAGWRGQRAGVHCGRAARRAAGGAAAQAQRLFARHPTAAPAWAS